MEHPTFKSIEEAIEYIETLPYTDQDAVFVNETDGVFTIIGTGSTVPGGHIN